MKMKTWEAGAVVVGLAIMLACSGGPSTSRPTRSTTVDAAKQSERMQFLQKLQEQGYIQKIDRPGAHPHVWVTPKFMGLKFDTKQSFISVVAAYYYDGQDDPACGVDLYEGINGRKIGEFDKLSGLQMK